MKNLKTIILLLLAIFSNAQIYVNVVAGNEAGSADLQLDSKSQGIGMPIVNLVSESSFAPIKELPKDGLLVYNNNVTDDLQVGYYYWRNLPSPHWEKAGGEVARNTIIQNINETVLGYKPSGKVADAPNTLNVNGANYTKTRCVKWEVTNSGNGHSYCGYKSNNSRTFRYAYDAAKSLGGYIVTIVSNAEWNFVKSNVINDGLFKGGDNLVDDMYLGYVSVASPGNKRKYIWITDETWDSNWGNNSSTQSFFATIPLSGQMSYQNPEPSTSNYSRCSYIPSVSVNSNREWYTGNCDSGRRNLIIEFNQ